MPLKTQQIFKTQIFQKTLKKLWRFWKIFESTAQFKVWKSSDNKYCNKYNRVVYVLSGKTIALKLLVFIYKFFSGARIWGRSNPSDEGFPRRTSLHRSIPDLQGRRRQSINDQQWSHAPVARMRRRTPDRSWTAPATWSGSLPQA